MRITERKLRKLIRKIILNEHGPASIRSTMRRKNPILAHLDFLPPLAIRRASLKNSSTKAVYEKVKDKIGIDESYQSYPNRFVINKTEENIEEFIKIFNSAPLDNSVKLKDDDGTSSSSGFNAEYLRSTINDKLPVILTTTIGDISGQFTTPGVVDRSNLDDVSWAIHDLYHQFGESNQLTGKYGKGYTRLPHFLFSDVPRHFSKRRDTLTKDHFNILDIPNERANIQKVASNIRNFFDQVGFTRGVKEFDIYPSVWAYVAMNIDEINNETIKELSEQGLSSDSIGFFIIMSGYVDIFKDWLANSENKIFINLTHPVMAN